MKTKSLIINLAAGALLCACSSDELAISGSEQKVFEGDKAYVTVNISDVGSSTRATSPGFEYGTEAEHTVTNAYFYFYDEDGVFVSHGEVWQDGEDGTTPNIEFESPTVIILKGLTERNYPKYVVTVLNKPNDFDAPDNLADMETMLANESEEGIKDASGNFTMSTTSYVGTAPYYFVTELDESNFSTEPFSIDADGNIVDEDGDLNPVEIYVERLAVKVTLDVGLTANENGLYLIDTTIAGGDNEQDDIDDNEGTDEIYVDLLGWKLNATARKSNIVKNINNIGVWGTGDSFLNFDWNDPDNHRSYWGMSYNYGLTEPGYPTSSNGNTPTEEEKESTWLNKYLKYVNLEDDDENDSPLLAIGASDYCAENTNTALNSPEPQIIKRKNSSAITSILVKAKICNADGEGLDVVRYGGTLFYPESFKEYYLNHLNKSGKLKYCYDTGVQNEQGYEIYSQILADDVDLEYSGSDGVVNVVLNVNSEDKVIYSYTDFEDITTYTAMDDGSYTLGSQTTEEGYDAVEYNGGLMYYNIPIEHLNNTYLTQNGIVTPYEANYGVVRNHHYYVTITSLETVGKGIYDPEEVIIPDEDEETYYVGANINILSWKIVQQSVGL